MKKMSDLISRQDALNAVEIVLWDGGEWYDEAIKSISSAEKHGKWLSDNLVGWLCSNCGEHIVLNVALHGNYCPNCGAKMDGDMNE